MALGCLLQTNPNTWLTVTCTCSMTLLERSPTVRSPRSFGVIRRHNNIRSESHEDQDSFSPVFVHWRNGTDNTDSTAADRFVPARLLGHPCSAAGGTSERRGRIQCVVGMRSGHTLGEPSRRPVPVAGSERISCNRTENRRQPERERHSPVSGKRNGQ